MHTLAAVIEAPTQRAESAVWSVSAGKSGPGTVAFGRGTAGMADPLGPAVCRTR